MLAFIFIGFIILCVIMGIFKVIDEINTPKDWRIGKTEKEIKFTEDLFKWGA